MTWKPQDREIYRYFNGVEETCADPFMLNAGLRACETYAGDSALVGDSLQRLDTLQPREAALMNEAIERLYVLMQNVFKIVPLQMKDGQPTGLSPQEAILLLIDYIDYEQKLKNSRAPSPT